MGDTVVGDTVGAKETGGRQKRQEGRERKKGSKSSSNMLALPPQGSRQYDAAGPLYINMIDHMI